MAPDFNATAVGTVQGALADELDQVRRTVQATLSGLGPWPEGADLVPSAAYAVWFRIWSSEMAQAVAVLSDVSQLLTHLSGFLAGLDAAGQTAFGD